MNEDTSRHEQLELSMTMAVDPSPEVGEKVENRPRKGPGFKGVILTKPLASRRLRLKLLKLKTRKLFLGNHLKNWSAYQL
jgi:hypothetical protein